MVCGVLVGDAVEVPVGVTLGVSLLVALPLSEVDPELEADAPTVTEGVGEEVTVVLALTVEVGVSGGVPDRKSVV